MPPANTWRHFIFLSSNLMVLQSPLAVLLKNIPLPFTTVVQKLNQGTIRNHGVADCGAFFCFFFGQTKKKNQWR
jgi:hypothetical protein